MSFKVAFQSLHELFPQVDVRILKAVAIEHSEDMDAAVEFIFNEVLPPISCQTEASYILPEKKENEKSTTNGLVSADPVCIPADENSKADDGHSKELGRPRSNNILLQNLEIISGASISSGSSVEPGTPVHALANHIVDASACLSGNITPYDSSVISYNRDSDVQVVSCEESRNASFLADPAQMPLGSGTLIHDRTLAEMSVIVPIDNLSSDFASQVNGQSFLLSANGTNADSVETETAASEKGIKRSYGSDSHLLSSFVTTLLSANGINSDSVETEATASEKEIKRSYGSASHLSSSSLTSTDFQDQDGLKNDFPSAECIHDIDSSAAALEDRLVPCESELITNSTSRAEHVDQEVCAFDNGADLFPFEIDMVSIDVNDQSSSMAARSVHAINTDYLEEFICDAKNNKKLLVSSMESLISMMKEVQLKEESAKQAREEASVAGLDTLLKAEELKQMLKHAKEANEMHAAEVYGEKSILATEARELQLRILNLSEKKDKSLKIIEEIHQSLEERMAAAEKEWQDAEQEKLRKEELARYEFKEQEAIMESIVNESKKLQQEADENHKLKQFLTDGGRIIDVLQGEIAVVCEDVLLLKYRVDNGLPLNKSISSSSSIPSLASSLHKSESSDKALFPPDNDEHVEVNNQEHAVLEMPIENSKSSNIHDSFPVVMAEDDWEIFDVSGISA